MGEVMFKVVYLIITIVAQGTSLNGWPETQDLIMKMPPGVTLAQCEADHKPAWDTNTATAQFAGYRCVEVDLLPTSRM